MTERDVIARSVGRVRADLSRTGSGSAALVRALDDVDRSLDRLLKSCDADEELTFHLDVPRAVAASYVRATIHLTEAGVESSQCEGVLRRGKALVIEELAEVQRTLLLATDDRHG